MTERRHRVQRLRRQRFDDLGRRRRQQALQPFTRALKIDVPVTRNDQQNRIIVELEDQRLHDGTHRHLKRCGRGLKGIQTRSSDDHAMVTARNQRVGYMSRVAVQWRRHELRVGAPRRYRLSNSRVTTEVRCCYASVMTDSTSNNAESSSATPAASWTAFTVEHIGDVAQVTLVGPGRGNAMGPDFWSELPQIFAELDADPNVRAVVLAGEGKNFSYGLDLPAMAGDFGLILAEGAKAGPRTQFHGLLKRMQSAINAVADCRKPVIAAIQGWCIGGGVDLISAADIRYASVDAQFSIREVKVAIVADMGSFARLPAIIGDGHLRELALTGKDIDAARAEKIGLVNDVFDDAAAVLAAAHATAREIAANPPLVVHGIKDVLDHSRSGAVDDSLRYVAAWNAAFLPSEDLTEAITAVFQKRAPKFEGA